MKVFVPHKKDFNIYFDEIMNYSLSTYVFGKVKDYDCDFDIVNIQFPEAIFEWLPPTKEQLIDLEQEFIKWKKHSKIVLLFNDHKSHYDSKNDFNNLFVLVQEYSDAVIHLGNYSLSTFKSLFSENCIQTVIYHPIYKSLLKEKPQSIDDFFNIDLNEKYVVSAIGSLRSKEEMKYVIKSFIKFPAKNKFLLIPKNYNFLELPKYLPYRFRKIYWYLIEKYYFFPLKKEHYHYRFKHINSALMVDLVQKTSLIIIPRLRSINSGLLFLGLTFDKIMLIPRIGNLTEVANFLKLPTVCMKTNSFKSIYAKLTSKKNEEYLKSKTYKDKKEQYMPKVIALHFDEFFDKLLKV